MAGPATDPPAGTHGCLISAFPLFRISLKVSTFRFSLHFPISTFHFPLMGQIGGPGEKAGGGCGAGEKTGSFFGRIC
jgi:hypothetical protein